MINPISEYATLVFDCDGVILDSNNIKTSAFREIALPWGEVVADKLVAYHIAHGGVSRYTKIAHFLDSIVPALASQPASALEYPGLDDLISNYSRAVRDGLMTCPIADRICDLRLQTSQLKWCVVSGSDQAELRHIFSARKIDHYFDGGIFGSPDDKKLILSREISSGSLRLPALFIGDSRYDHVVSTNAGLDFVFVSDWTDLADWRNYVSEHHLSTITALSDLLSLYT